MRKVPEGGRARSARYCTILKRGSGIDLGVKCVLGLRGGSW